MGETALIPVCFHATTIAGEVLEGLIDKKCGGFMKINAAKSAGKERERGGKSGKIRPKCPVDFVRKFDIFSAPLPRF
jgi:hypothetical protein